MPEDQKLIPLNLYKTMEKTEPSIDKTIDSLMYKHGKDLDQAIEKYRKDSIKNQADHLIESISSYNRCPICTLKLPCRHYKTAEDVPEQQKTIRTSPELQINTPSSISNNSFHLPKTFKIRFRGKSKESPKYSPKTSEFDKLKTMEKLEKYKEEKLLKEIQQIEDIKKTEELSLEMQKEKEKKRTVYYSKQKDKLIAYHNELKIKMDLLIQRNLSEELQTKMNQIRAQKLQQEKREQVSEYRLKKRLFERPDLSPDFLRTKPTQAKLKSYQNSPQIILPSKSSS